MRVMYLLLPCIVVVVVVLTINWYIKTTNKLTQKKLLVNQAFSNIDVWLTNRYNVLTNMVETVRDYTAYESKTLEKLVALRSNLSAAVPGDVREVQAVENAMQQVEKELTVQVENYPSLGANSLFHNLQNSIRDTEDNLQAAHRSYNAAVTEYNTAIALFPARIVAGLKGCKPFTLFQADEKKRSEVSVKL